MKSDVIHSSHGTHTKVKPTEPSVAGDFPQHAICTCGHTGEQHYWSAMFRQLRMCSWCNCKQFTIAKVCPLCKTTIGG